jgi:CDP-diglyceride synthetase
MIAVIFAILLISVIMILVGCVIGFFFGRSVGREETEYKYAPKKDWKKKENVSYERKV